MDAMELIRHRKSIRTYNGEGFPLKEQERIMSYAAEIENPYGIPVEYRILNADKHGLSSPVIVGADTYIAGKIKRLPHAEEAFGYSFEKLVLYADSLGIGTVWIGGTMNRDAFERAMDLKDDEVLPCVSPLGYKAEKQSLRETMMRKGVKADSRLRDEKLFFDGAFDKPLAAENAGNLQLALEMVRLAPSAVNGQPWRLVLCGDRVHFYEKRGRGMASDTWDIQKIDMGIALCHFELGAIESGLHPVMEVADPGIPGQDGLIYIASFRIE